MTNNSKRGKSGSERAEARIKCGGQPVNRTLYHGDNLVFLRGINSNSIDLIATDPPFNKGRDFHATPDSVSKGAKFQDRWTWNEIEDEWIDKLEDDFPKLYNVIKMSNESYGNDMGAFLCFMAVRLLEMKRILKDTGSIYLHCDPTASHYLKMVMDAIFGKKNFRNELIWWYSWGVHTAKHWNKKHDVILYYAKDAKKVFFDGNRVRVPYRQSSGMTTDPKWNKSYNEDGKLPEDVLDIATINAMSKERTGYPTQKPLELYRRIIKASSNAEDMVLDPFCGCATTLVAAEQLERHWIGIDLWKKAHKVVWDRFKDEWLITPEGEKKGLGVIKNEATIIYQTTPPERTDDGEEAVPALKAKIRREPPGERMSRAKIFETLVSEHRTDEGIKCVGCNRVFDDERYFHLDHKTPRSQGGINDISNRMLLCGPCNGIKGDTRTLKGLQNRNKELRRMV